MTRHQLHFQTQRLAVEVPGLNIPPMPGKSELGGPLDKLVLCRMRLERLALAPLEGKVNGARGAISAVVSPVFRAGLHLGSQYLVRSSVRGCKLVLFQGLCVLSLVNPAAVRKQ